MKRLNKRWGILGLLIVVIGAAWWAIALNGKQRALAAEERRIHCLDHFCLGDVTPILRSNEVAQKLNGQWYIAPREYFGGFGRGGFEWWEHKPLNPNRPRPTSTQALAVDGKGHEFSIDIFFRSKNFPPEPKGFKLIELAKKNGWIKKQISLRPGLEVIEMGEIIGPAGHRIDHVTYYIATQIEGLDGQPPVAQCNHNDPRNSGGSGFLWKDGVYVGIGMNQRHCADWPEIYQEVIRVLSLLRKV